MTESAVGHRINPFSIHRSDGDRDDDPWMTAGMPGMIGSRIKPMIILGGVKKRNPTGAAKSTNKERNEKTVRFGRCINANNIPPTAGAHLRDFMHATSMHGLKYAAEKEATWIER